MRATVSAILAFGLVATVHAAPPSDAKVMAAAISARAGQLALLEKIVGIDSGTGDAAGAGKVQAILADELRAIGATVTLHPAEAAGLGDNLVARLEGSGRGRILIIAHIDTVYPPGTVASRPLHIEGDRLTGPGVSDEKGGAVEAVTALTLLHGLGVADYRRIVLLVESSEETGSPGTRALIATLLKDADVELNMEPGDAPDAITVWRKGSSTITITVHGRAAHAGVSPQDGRNAATELLHQLTTVEHFPHSGDGITVNLTTLKAGDRPNVIPDRAAAEINVRVREAAQLDTILAAFRAAARTTVVPDTVVEIGSTPAFPPLPDNPATMRLAVQAREIYAATGRALRFAGNGGASESALAAAAGVPALDGLGPVGGGFHSAREYLDLTTVTPRLFLLARLLIQLGASPPAR